MMCKREQPLKACTVFMLTATVHITSLVELKEPPKKQLHCLQVQYSKCVQLAPITVKRKHCKHDTELMF